MNKFLTFPYLFFIFLNGRVGTAEATSWWLPSTVKIPLIPNHKFTQAGLSNNNNKKKDFLKKKIGKRIAEKLKGEY